MRNVRMIYKKMGRAKYISHLDVNRLMLRVIKRSCVPIWFTEGYNTHAYIAFPLPLPLGMESEYDLMDFRITDDSLDNATAAKMISAAMPDCIKVVELIEPVLKNTDLCYADYSFELECDGDNAKKIIDMLGWDEILVEKLTKKKELKQFDIREKIVKLEWKSAENGIHIDMTVPAGNIENINPMLLFNRMQNDGCDFSIISAVREMLYDKNMQIFR